MSLSNSVEEQITQAAQHATLRGITVPQVLLILVLQLVAMHCLPALCCGLTEMVPDAPAKKGALAQVTPASPPAVTVGPAQHILQSLHSVHPPSMSSILTEHPRHLYLIYIYCVLCYYPPNCL